MNAAAFSPDPASRPLISYDPAAGEWLVLVPQPVAGMPAYVVAAANEQRAVAEQAAGLHDSPVHRWLLHDPIVGWRAFGGWSPDLRRAQLFHDRDTAVHDYIGFPGVELFVLRASGLVTCPDIPATSTVG